MKKLLISLLVFFLFKQHPHCQKSARTLFYCRFAEDSGAIRQCKLQQQNAFVKDEQAEKAVDMILSQLGLERTFILVYCPNIRNAVAVVPEDGYRYIVYDNRFMQRINQAATTQWASISILAHEIGHHLNGHTIKSPSNLAEQRQRELAADKFSGFVLCKLHATLGQATAAIHQFKDNGDDRNSDHPNSNSRLLAIETGYNNARDKQPLALDAEVALSPDKLFYEGYDLYHKEKYREAIEKFTAAIQLKPDFVRAYNGRGNSKGLLKDYTGAIGDFDKALSIDPNSAFSYTDRGLAKDFLKDYSGAIADYTAAIALQPDSYLAYNRRGLVKNDDLKDYLGAYADYSKAIEFNSGYADAYTNRGVSRFCLNDRSGACEDFRRGCDLGNAVGCRNAGNLNCR